MHIYYHKGSISNDFELNEIESNHTDQYLKEMNRFYKEIFDAAHEVQLA